MTKLGTNLKSEIEMSQRRLFAPPGGNGQRVPRRGDVFRREAVAIHFDSAERFYEQWPSPVCIISDGPYGVSGFPGDEHKTESLVEWYRPHVQAWSARSTAQTTLWFWGTELGWATVHPLLEAKGWEYRCCNVWDKGMSHVAGNANTQTLRKFPGCHRSVRTLYNESAVFVGRQAAQHAGLAAIRVAADRPAVAPGQ